MQQSVNITSKIDTSRNNAYSIPVPKAGSPGSFRNTLTGFLGSPSPVTAGSVNARDNILDTIAQARATTAPALSAKPSVLAAEPFDIRAYYSMPPEEVAPRARELSEELHGTDFTGMTGVEVYEYIENRYKEVFGDDFMMAHSLLGFLYNTGEYYTGMNPNRSSNEQFMIIGSDFYGAVNSLTLHLRSKDTPPTEINRARLYGNKSSGEIMDAIIAKYPQPPTNRSLALMNEELYSVGLGTYDLGRYIDAHIMRPGESAVHGTMPQWKELANRWSLILDSPANVPLLSAIQNVHLQESRTHAASLPWAMQAKDMLVKLGAPLGSDGYFLYKLSKEQLLFLFGIGDDVEGPGSLAVEVKRDLIDDFIELLDQHDKHLRESREAMDERRDLSKNYMDSLIDAEILSGNIDVKQA